MEHGIRILKEELDLEEYDLRTCHLYKASRTSEKRKIKKIESIREAISILEKADNNTGS